MSANVLLVFSGLPGVGKSTLAKRLAARLGAVYLRVDTIEQALRDLCDMRVGAEGYGLACRLALDNLALGLSVVADSCNPVEQSRRDWAAVARASAVACVNIEVICSDAAEHRARVETRSSDVPGLTVPTWSDVLSRDHEAWAGERITLDTAHRSVDASFAELVDALADATPGAADQGP